LDMLGGGIAGAAVSVTGFDNPDNIIGWNLRPAVWPYPKGSPAPAWALAAITNTGGMV